MEDPLFGNAIAYGRALYTTQHHATEAFKIKGREFIIDRVRAEGADLGILTCQGRMMNKKFKLNERAGKWIDGLNGIFQTRPLDPFENAPETALVPGAFKML